MRASMPSSAPRSASPDLSPTRTPERPSTVEALDLSDILIETDSPYLAPVPMRGRQNTPLYVEYVARKIAEIKHLDYEEVAKATFRNACEFYRIPAGL